MAGSVSLQIVISASDLASPKFATIAKNLANLKNPLNQIAAADLKAAAAAQKLQQEQLKTQIQQQNLTKATTNAETADIKQGDAFLKLAMTAQKAKDALGKTEGASSKASAVLSKLGSMGQWAGGKLLELGKAAIQGAIGIAVNLADRAGQALVQFGQDSVQSAGDFQSSMLKNVALAGLSADQVGKVSDALMQMSLKVGKKPQELADAIYPIYSSGFKGAEGLNLLEKATMSATAGHIQATTVANAAGAAFNAFGLRTSNSATNVKLMNNEIDVMNATISAGNMQWGNYASKIGDLSSKAAQSHIKFTDANAALAVFTNAGDSVQLAGTHLGAMFQSMALDTDKYVKRAKAMNISFDSTKFASLDLAGKIKYLNDVTGGDASKAKSILGNKTLASTYLKLRDHMKDYQSTLKGLNNAQGATDVAFKTTEQGYQEGQAKMSAAFEVLKIKVGSALLPVLAKITTVITPIIVAFADWISKSGILAQSSSWLAGAFDKIVGFIGKLNFGPIVGSLQKLGTTIMSYAKPALDAIAKWAKSVNWQAVAKNGIDFISKAIDLVGTGIKIAMPYVLSISKALIQFGQDVATRLWPIISNFLKMWNASWPVTSIILKGVWTEIVGIVKIAWALVSGIVKIGLDILGGNWKQAWTDFKDMLKGVWDGIKTYLQGALTIVAGMFKPLFQMLANIPGPVGAMAKGVLKNIDNMGKDADKSTQAMSKKTQANIMQMKTGALLQAVGMHTQMAKRFDMMRQDILKQIQNTTDPAVKQHLQMKLKIVENAEDMEKKAVKQSEDMANKTVVQFALMKDGGTKHTGDLNTQVTGKFRALSDTLVGHSIVPDMVNAIVKWFADLPGKAVTAVQSLAGQMGTFFSGLATSATTWGSNLIKNFIGGIGSMLGAVGDAAGKVMSKVAAFLKPGSPTKEGVGQTLMLWGPNLVKNFAQTMTQATPQARKSAENMMVQVRDAINTDTMKLDMAKLSGNKAQTKELDKQLSLLHAQMDAYKRIVAADGYTYKAKGGNTPIDFTHHIAKKKKTPTKYSQDGYGPVYASGSGASVGNSANSSGGGYGSSGATTVIINNTYNFTPSRGTTQQEAEEIYQYIKKRQTKDARVLATYTNSSSGAA